jgi:monovalent cation:H+ antiporter, CPA1 family
MLDLTAIGLVVTALLAWLNYRFLRLPMTIGVMSIALLLSVSLIGLARLGFGGLLEYEAKALRSIDFSQLLMQGMLSILLFAGALHVDLGRLRAFRWQIGVLAFAGTALSTLLIGGALYLLLPICGYALPMGLCLVFGALISPTDPIAVMNMLRTARAPESLSTVIAGESLFNDGVGVVLFALISTMTFTDEQPTAVHAMYLLVREAIGGLAFGALLGAATLQLLRGIDSYQEEVMLTLAAVVGGYALANHLHTSGPLAMVVAGVIVGNRGQLRTTATSPAAATAAGDAGHSALSLFWELLDAILNAVLFVLIGLEVILIPWGSSVLLACLGAIVICLAARWLSVGAPVHLLIRTFDLPPRSGMLLTWGGLRGGISVALALSLPTGSATDLLLSMTYSVVVVSILVQGLSFGRLARRCTQLP